MTIKPEAYVIYKLYFGWNISPKDVYYFCKWYAWVDSYSQADNESIIRIVDNILLGLPTPHDLTTMRGEDIIKFMRKYQFNSILGRIKNVLWGVLIIVLKVLGLV